MSVSKPSFHLSAPNLNYVFSCLSCWLVACLSIGLSGHLSVCLSKELFKCGKLKTVLYNIPNDTF